jgi:pimeloyl-ACP methyl ester carboxylesterase
VPPGLVQFDETADWRLAMLKDGSDDELGRCGFFWLGGFMSDMTGSKALSLSGLAHRTRRNCFRFDYSGHGQSGGAFTDGTISLWLEQSSHMFVRQTRGKRIVIGSSMGGWLALLLLRHLLEKEPSQARRIAGLVLIAPAVDMTRTLMWDRIKPHQQKQLLDSGQIEIPSDYGSPYPITSSLIADGENHLMFGKTLDVGVPVRILQGSDDKDVPVAHAERVLNMIQGDDITLTMIKDGDHRLSSPQQLKFLQETVLRLAERADGMP